MTRGKEAGDGLKYQINWFTIDDLNDLGITSMNLSYINPSEEQLIDIKNLCVSWMKNNGYIMIPNPEHRIKLNNRRRLINFGVQFHHIINEL